MDDVELHQPVKNLRRVHVVPGYELSHGRWRSRYDTCPEVLELVQRLFAASLPRTAGPEATNKPTFLFSQKQCINNATELKVRRTIATQHGLDSNCGRVVISTHRSTVRDIDRERH